MEVDVLKQDTGSSGFFLLVTSLSKRISNSHRVIGDSG